MAFDLRQVETDLFQAVTMPTFDLHGTLAYSQLFGIGGGGGGKTPKCTDRKKE